MTDLISRQAAIDALRRAEALTRAFGYHNVIDTIREIPSAQQEIVRCKDCKYYEIYELKADNTDDKRYKPSVCVKGRFAVKRRDDWFCADAERRTDE